MPSALITGGTGGLGRAVTLELLGRGWRSVVPYGDADRAAALAAAAAGRGELELVAADMLDAEQAALVAQRADVDGVPLAAVVNLIGGFEAPGLVHEVPVERFEALLTANLRATYLTCAATLPALLGHGSGTILCVSAQAVQRPFPGAAGYITAKAAILGLADALAVEYAGHGIRVNTILPGVIDTPANRAAQPGGDTSTWSAPEEIARVVAFLCSPESSAVTGARVPV